MKRAPAVRIADAEFRLDDDCGHGCRPPRAAEHRLEGVDGVKNAQQAEGQNHARVVTHRRPGRAVREQLPLEGLA